MLPYINVPFEYVGGRIGASVDELKLIFSFLISYPLAAVLKRIPDSKPWQKNVFTISVSLFYLLGLFNLGTGLIVLLINAIGAYAIAFYIDGPFMPWIAFVFLMGYMSVSHIYRQIVEDPSVVDITGAQMVMIMRLTAFCWNVHDGQLPESDLSDFQKDRAIRQLPSLLDYFGYVFFFPSLLIGPAFDYVDYERYITTTMFNLPPGVDPSKAPPTRKKRRIPRSGRPAGLKAATGIGWILLFLNLSGYYYPDYLLSPEYMTHGFFRRVWLLHMVGVVTRMKYYGVWTLTEGACILSGIGYKGVDPVTGKASWDRLQNVKPFAIELAQNTHAYLGNWNINTNHWLRNYVYLRVTAKGKKPGFRASMATFITSAFWHGFYPGYYLTFVLASFNQYIAKNARRLFRPFFIEVPSPTAAPPTPGTKPKEQGTKYKIYYDIATWFITQAAFSFTVAPFILLTFSASMTVWVRVYCYCIIGVIASVAFLFSPGKAYVVKQLKRRTGTDKRPEIARQESARAGTTLGLPDDPEQELQEIVAEVKKEIESRRQRGMSVDLDVKKVVQEKLDALRNRKADDEKKEL
ncbi:MBOAT family protein [Rhizodiscina lignyota]|uniref:MBOAT family protein n=1 Tax=Rhizodiscina lignyota TaxID=1504668 RepID=A0A9P4M2V1_9PEZI|nr:MBOAT family protein [Rhizodiscina lignyota]